MTETDKVVREAQGQIRGKIIKNKLYEIFDAITMVFSPLIENLFDYAKEQGGVQTAQTQRLYVTRLRREHDVESRSAGEHAGQMG